MSDLYHDFGSDLIVDGGGSLVFVSGRDETQKRIIRRLSTNTGCYIWNITYGGGLPSMVGAAVDAQRIRAVVVSQMGLESSVDLSQPLDVEVRADQEGRVFCQIQYVDVSSGLSQSVFVST